MVKSIPLLDGTIVVMLSNGPVTIIPHTYNFDRIVKALPTATEQEILDLLVTPSFPDGTFTLYLYDSHYYIYHLNYSGASVYTLKDNKLVLTSSRHDHRNPTILTDLPPLGIYASLDEIRYDFPELFL